MTKNRFGVAGLRILPKSLFFALSAYDATVPPKVTEQPVGASSEGDDFLPRVRRKRAKGLLPPVLQDESNGFAKIRQALFPRFALGVGARDFGALSDVPPSRSTIAVNSLCMRPF
jgi:hypothetical protein